MDRIIKSLSEILEKRHKDISDLLVFSRHKIHVSGTFGSRVHSTLSTFEIISPPAQTSELNELVDEKKKVIYNAVILLFPVQDKAPEITEIIYKADPMLSRANEFVQFIDDIELINDISLAMNLLERKPPKFWLDYRSSLKTQLLEDYYRSEFYRMLGMKYQVGSEEESKTGRTDLTLKSSSINRKIFEFKVWNRNGYLDTSTQVLAYLTEIEDSGFVIMGNNRKTKNITEIEYKKVIESKEYIDNSMQIKQTTHGLRYYEACYDFNGNTKKIYHFILNLK